MTETPKIAFRMGPGTITELLTIYTFHLNLTWSDDYEQLLAAHVVDMYHRLRSMQSKVKTIGTLEMSLSEATAFYQYWNVIDTSRWPLATVIICDMIKKIDKRRRDRIGATTTRRTNRRKNYTVN